MSTWIIFRTIPRQPYYSRPGMAGTEAEPVVAVDSKHAGNSRFLFRTGDCYAPPACAVHCVGRLRCSPDTLTPRPALASYHLSGLGNLHRTPALAMSADCAR